jgi:hypothetical protein
MIRVGSGCLVTRVGGASGRGLNRLGGNRSRENAVPATVDQGGPRR